MMRKLLFWTKSIWQFLTIIILVVFLLNRQTPVRLSRVSEYSGLGEIGLSKSAPAPEVKDRLVVKNSYLSLLVKNVRQVQESIIQKAEELGGYMVSSQIDSPYGVDSGSVTVRVPEDKLPQVLQSYRDLSIRVVSENLVGRDVTDEYVDIGARLETLGKTKAKFEEILSGAEKVTDILQVQRELVALQEQIDSLKGRQQYLEKTAQWSKVTVYLATDELALPYKPSQPWRPKVIFKQAVRSLVKSGRWLGTLAIWLVVYSVILVPVLLIVRLIKKRKARASQR